MITERHKRLVQNIGKARTKQELLEAAGYTKSYARAGQIQHTEGYKKVMATIIEQLEQERQRIIDALKVKDLDKEKHRDLVDAMDKITKNIQLLSGGATERQSLTLSFDSTFDETTQGSEGGSTEQS